MSKQEYPYTEGAPPPIEDDQYFQKLSSDYHSLLDAEGDNEEPVQKFFEENPCLVPGARADVIDNMPSGHGPLYGALITQPKIQGLKKRIPDFLWLAYDSLVFNPIFIEIESPNKRHFNGDGSTSRDFNQARTQIEEWQAVLNQPESQLAFYRDFGIPDFVRKKKWNPLYVLIYGRRSEFEGDDWLSQKRASLQSGNLRLMSFDRLTPTIAKRNYVCCEVSGGKFIAKTLSPTFTLGPNHESLLKIEGLTHAVDSMVYTSGKRKKFLKQKIPVCLEYLRSAASNNSFALPTPKSIVKRVE